MILITGANGFLGRNIVEIIIKGGMKCRCLIRDTSVRDFSKFIADISKKYNSDKDNVSVVKCDLLHDHDTILRSFEGVKSVIHCASVVYSGNKKDFDNINVKTTEFLARTAKDKAKSFVFVSTSLVATNDKSIYAQSKAQAEKKLIETLSNSSTRYFILRPSIIIGEYDKKNLAQIIKNMIKFRFAIMIGRGDYLIQPVYVKDVASLCLSATNKKDIEQVIVVLAPDHIIKFRRFLKLISKNISVHSGKRSFIIPIPVILIKTAIRIFMLIFPNSNVNIATLNRMMNVKMLDNSDAKKFLGYKPTPISESVEKTVLFFLKHSKKRS